MECKIGNVHIRLQFWFFLIVGLFAYLDPTDSVGLVLLAIVVHEMGHIIAMACCGVGVRELELGPFGARICTDKARVRSYIAEMFIYLAGPLSGILTAAVCLSAWSGEGNRFALINMGLSAFNLLPIETLDGGSFLYAVLSGFLGPIKAAKWLKAISYSVMLPLFGLSFYLLMQGGQNISLLITCTYLGLTALLR